MSKSFNINPVGPYLRYLFIRGSVFSHKKDIICIVKSFLSDNFPPAESWPMVTNPLGSSPGYEATRIEAEHDQVWRSDGLVLAWKSRKDSPLGK